MKEIPGIRIKGLDGKITIPQMIFFVLGLFFIAFGIDFLGKTGLGISPLTSVCYTVSKLTGLALGLTSWIYYIILIFLQWILLRSKFPPIQFLQLLTSLVTSAFIQLCDDVLPEVTTWPVRIPVIVVSIFLIGLGVALSAGMHFVPNPGEGAALAISQVLHKDFGFGKNAIDLISVALAVLIGLIFGHRIIGIGIGTLCAMIFTGRVVKLLTGPVARLYARVT